MEWPIHFKLRVIFDIIHKLKSLDVWVGRSYHTRARAVDILTFDLWLKFGVTSDWEAKIIVNCYFINYVERGHSTVNKVD